MQLIMAQTFTFIFVLLCMLSITCEGGERLLLSAKTYIEELSQIPSDSNHITDFQDTLQNLNIDVYCLIHKDVTGYGLAMMVAALMLVASQAMMVACLNGERERVAEELYHMDQHGPHDEDPGSYNGMYPMETRQFE